MSELDTLSDSEWLDISSGRDSDDNDSLSGNDSDRDEISSMPRSRRSSISNEGSMTSEIDAWEGFVSDSGDETLDAVLGMYHASFIPAAVGAEPIAVGFEPRAQGIDPFIAEEDQRVKEALDQSFVGTLSSSRSSTGASGHSTHTSIRDLRLSFPDPLTSSRDDLNRSYEAVSSPTESTVSSSTDNDVNNLELKPAASIIPSPPMQDPGLLPTTPEVRHHEVQHLEYNEKQVEAELEIFIYGPSSEVKWKFVQELILKAATVSGSIPVDSLRGNEPIQTLRFIKDSDTVAPFFNAINVYDRTNDTVKEHIDPSDGPSLAIVYLPAAKLPILAWHDAYLPVVVPSVTDLDNTVMLQVAEDDWDLLAVPSDRLVKLGASKSSVFDPEHSSHITAAQTYRVLRGVGHDTKKIMALKPLSEQVKSINAVTLFALMSIIMGFAFNTAFRPATPAPTPTVNTPSSSNGHMWGLFSPQPNRSALIPSTGCTTNKATSGSADGSSLKNMALSVFNPDSTSLSVTPPAAAKSLSSVASTSKEVIAASITSPAIKCHECGSSSKSVSSEKPRASTDVIVRSSGTISLSAMSYMKTAMSVTASHTDSGSGSTISLGTAERVVGAIPMSTIAAAASAAANINLNAVSEVFDATTKALAEAVGTDFAELAEAADELLTSLREQRDNVIRQSKGKARAFGEQLLTLNVEVVSRNKRAMRRAKELREKGKEIVRGASNELKVRTDRARRRAKALKNSVVEGGNEVWKNYEKAHGDWEGLLTLKRGPGKENEGGGCWEGARRSVNVE